MFDVDAVMRSAGVDASAVRGISAAELRASGGDRIRENATTGLAFGGSIAISWPRGGSRPSLWQKNKWSLLWREQAGWRSGGWLQGGATGGAAKACDLAGRSPPARIASLPNRRMRDAHSLAL